MTETNTKSTQAPVKRSVYYKRSDLRKKERLESFKKQQEYKKKIISEINKQNQFASTDDKSNDSTSNTKKNTQPNNTQTKHQNNMKNNNGSSNNNQNRQVKNTSNNTNNSKNNNKTNNKNFKNNDNSKALKLIFLGGLGEVGKNIMGVEYDDEIFILDAGSAFPSEDLPGIDLIVPDIDYLIRNKHKVKAILITHGHEDHIGGLPHVLNYIDAPIYGSKMANALIQKKLSEHPKKIRPKMNTVKAGDKINIGKNFNVEFLHVNHSISGTFGMAIKSPVGTWVHTGDFKIDYTPLDGKVTDLQRLAQLGQEGVLLLTADSTNSEREGSTISEKKVGDTLNNIMEQYKEKRIIVSTFASNTFRVQQLVNLAKKQNRKIVFSGRSMLNVTEIAAKTGDLTIDKDAIIPMSRINKYKNSEIMVISTGSQGEPFSALTRMAKGEFKGVKLSENDVVILSSSPIPGNEKAIGKVINNLYKTNAEVIYNALAEVHVSGHAKREELKIIHNLVKPKFFIPVHGEYRMLKTHIDLATSLGMPERKTMLAEIGDVVSITKNDIKKTGQVQSGRVLVDGFGYGDMESEALTERRQLAEDGVCVVMIGVNKATGSLEFGPEILAKGFIYSSDNDALLEGAKKNVLEAIQGIHLSVKDRDTAKDAIKKSLSNYFQHKAKRKPMVLPFILEN